MNKIIRNYFTLICVIFITLAFGSNTFAADKGYCTVGMELGPGDSCSLYGTFSDESTLSVDDGIARHLNIAYGFETITTSEDDNPKNLPYPPLKIDGLLTAINLENGRFRITYLEPYSQPPGTTDRGTCAVGMVLGPGESCTYPDDSGDKLSVNADKIAEFHSTYITKSSTAKLPDWTHTHGLDRNGNRITKHGKHQNNHGGNGGSHSHPGETQYGHLEVSNKITAANLEDGTGRYKITFLADTASGDTGTGDTGTGNTDTSNTNVGNTGTGDTGTGTGGTGIGGTATGGTGTGTVTGTESGTATAQGPGPSTPSSQLSVAGQISFSELMFTSRGGLRSLPQWIELYNNSDTETVNLNGWQLTIEARDADGTHRHAVIPLQELRIPPNETALIVTWSGRHSEEIQDSRIYNFVSHHSGDFEQNEHRNMVLGFKGFFLKLADPYGAVSDTAGNIDGDPGTEDKPLWEIPAGTTEDGERTSLFRRYANGGKDPLDGTDANNWRRAANFGRVGDLSALAVSRYYGRNTDIGNPGYKGAGALPVALSSFRAVLKETGVLLSWTTESELENAGFNILRSVSKNGHFLKVNPRLIQGAGTTSERNTYTWTDTTAKPTTVYFYQIEDISYSGERTRFATIQMRGYVSAQDKLATRWADLKNRE